VLFWLLKALKEKPCCCPVLFLSHPLVGDVAQLWQSVIIPPPPFGGYVRGITTRTTVEMMQELQTEARRLREGSASDDRQEAVVPEEVVPLVEQWKLSKRSAPGRRKSSRKSQWRIRSE
jgi:hypothetical protein